MPIDSKYMAGGDLFAYGVAISGEKQVSTF